MTKKQRIQAAIAMIHANAADGCATEQDKALSARLTRGALTPDDIVDLVELAESLELEESWAEAA